MLPTKVRFLQAYHPYVLGHEMLVGRGQTIGGGVATELLKRQIIAVVPDDSDTEPRAARVRRGG